jgi:hypothetical protein
MAAGIFSRIVAYENDWFNIFFSLAMLTGMLIWALDVAIRIRQGTFRFRPWDAFVKLPLMLAILMAIHFIFVFFEWTERSLTESLIMNPMIAFCVLLSTTAYRKPTA